MAHAAKTAKKARKTRPAGRAHEPLRFAVVGQGYFAQAAVLPAFARAQGCELRALFSEDATKLRALKRKYGVAAALGYEQYDDYLRSGEVDAVYVTVPNDQHRQYVERAAQAGVHVLCEKPLGVDAKDAEAMIAACQSANVRLMTAYRLHFEAATLEAIQRVQSGEIGRPRFFASTFAMQVRKGNIRTSAARGGGPLLDLGIYCVNAARSLFRAEPTEVMAIAASRESDSRFAEVDEQVTAILRFPDERVAQFTCSFGAYDHSTLTVVGEKGRVRLDPAYDYAVPLKLVTEIEGKKPREKTFAKRDQVAAERVMFARAVREGRDPEPSGREGLADLRVLDAITRAIESRRVESVGSGSEPAVEHPNKNQRIERPPHGMPDLVHARSPGQD
jgi:predicted dehydrogenase